EHEVGAVASAVVDRHPRKDPPEPVPPPAVVQRDVHTRLAPGVQESLACRVLADDAREVVGPYSVRDLRPGPSVVRGLPEVWLELAVLVARRRDVRRASVVVRGLLAGNRGHGR